MNAFAGYTVRRIRREDDAALAAIIRRNFEQHGLAVPGTVYFDPELDRLSTVYLAGPGTDYFVLTAEDGTVLGGIGYAAFPLFEGCAECQKLYLADGVKGRGLGRALVGLCEEKARAAGYRSLYMETNAKFAVAVALYRKLGYTEIDRPACVNHAAMDRFFLKTI
ncbi:MAG: GNAT family N-acetyltransferase [Clostridia bacterium]|nr:GNAT family N-acetyltransferase [Clostridia bacterium]